MSVVPLPAGTTLGKSFEYGLDINLGTAGSPSWQPIRRISAWAPSYPGTPQDQATYDDLGATNEAITARSFATSFTVQGNRSLTSGLFLPEVEALLAAAGAGDERTARALRSAGEALGVALAKDRKSVV